MCPTIFSTVMELATAFSMIQLKKVGAQGLRQYLIQTVCRSGDLEVIKMVVELLRLTPEEVCNAEVIGTIPKLTIELAKWLLESYQLSKAGAAEVFRCACVQKSLATAQWIVDRFQLTKDDLFPTDEREQNSAWLACVLATGNTEIAKWFIETYNITSDDIDGKTIIGSKCETIIGSKCFNLGTMQYLATTFTFQRADVLEAFTDSCCIGNLRIAKFLAEYYVITESEARRENKALKCAANSLVTEWLLDTYYKDAPTN